MSIEYNYDDCLVLHFIKWCLLSLKEVSVGKFIFIDELACG